MSAQSVQPLPRFGEEAHLHLSTCVSPLASTLHFATVAWCLTPETITCFHHAIHALSRSLLTNATCPKQREYLFVSSSFSRYCLALGHRPVGSYGHRIVLRGFNFQLLTFPYFASANAAIGQKWVHLYKGSQMGELGCNELKHGIIWFCA